MKTCSKCRMEKDESAFSMRKNGHLMAWCKKCCNKTSCNHEFTTAGHRVPFGEAAQYNQAAEIRRLLFRLAS